MSKELTPMQEAIEIINEKSKENNSMEFQYGLNYAFRILTELLPKEEQFIVNSIIECDKLCLQAQDYYNNKFK